MRFIPTLSKFILAVTLAPIFAVGAAKRETFVELSRDAYVWGYPAVLLKKTRDSMLGTQNISAKVNHFFHSAKVRDPQLRDITSANTDSLYSWAWVLLDQQPLVLFQPALKDRYASVVVVDAFSNVVQFLNGLDSEGKSNVYYLTGPKWKGRLPAGAKQIVSSTSEVFVLAQAFVRDSKDAKKVALQMKRHQLISWSDWQNGVREDAIKLTPPKTRELVQKNLAAPGLSFFEELRQVIARNDLSQSDTLELKRFEKLGIGDNVTFAKTLTDPDARDRIERGLYEGERAINTRVTAGVGSKVNGWSFEMTAPAANDDFLLRAAIAKERYFSVPASQAINIRVDVDSESRQLNSAHDYQLRFEKEDLPLTKAGWSLSIIPSRSRNTVDKSLTVYSVSENNLKMNRDGSVVIMIQTEAPDRGRGTNWLPLPVNSNFALLLSAYSPGKSILAQKYIAPSLIRADEDSVPQQKIVRRMMAFSK
ncbi:MAG: DUF1254 domain-containing protein [Bdellovibrionaceae bacterium]|nr:DUF1254 domain-containing protein [Pseudobdellovibrionaceae bacterium]